MLWIVKGAQRFKSFWYIAVTKEGARAIALGANAAGNKDNAMKKSGRSFS